MGKHKFHFKQIVLHVVCALLQFFAFWVLNCFLALASVLQSCLDARTLKHVMNLNTSMKMFAGNHNLLNTSKPGVNSLDLLAWSINLGYVDKLCWCVSNKKYKQDFCIFYQLNKNTLTKKNWHKRSIVYIKMSYKTIIFAFWL